MSLCIYDLFSKKILCSKAYKYSKYEVTIKFGDWNEDAKGENSILC